MTDRGEIDGIRALLSSKPRPVGWAERRQRLDEVGSAWPVAGDIKLSTVDVDGVAGEWSIAPGSDESRVLMFPARRRLLLRLHCKPPPHGDRGRARRRSARSPLAIAWPPSIRFPQPSMTRLSRGAFCAGKASAQGASPSAATVPAAA
jgi:hypothetical protein